MLRLVSHFSPFVISASSGANTVEISYTAFVSIMLTAVSIILAALGLVFAIVAVIGWNTIGERVSSLATTFLQNSFKDGGDMHKTIGERVSSLATTFLQNSFKDGGDLHTLVKKETQSIIYKGVEAADLSETPNEEKEEDQ
jgi:hypothetical protein